MTKSHHYTECGLNNVYIHGIKIEVDDDGDQVMTIPAINSLHRTIAKGIVLHKSGMSGDELRFLRTELGLTQARLAQMLHRDKQSVGRWERNEIEIYSTAEALLRRLAIEQLELPVDLGIAELSARSVRSANLQPIEIDLKADSNETLSYELRAA